MKWIEAIKQVLQEEGQPLHYTAITKKIIEKGYREKDKLGMTPSDTVSMFITTDKTGAFERVSKGVYTLVAALQNTTPAAESESRSYEEEIEDIYNKYREQLAKDLLVYIRSKKDQSSFMEQLVIDLLLAMGYGASAEDAGAVIGKSHDGGVDGVIKEDKLGLEEIYVQAKNWEANIGNHEITSFIGALVNKGARKGIFITTSKFTASARKVDPKNTNRIKLIDGEQLVQLMIDYNIGIKDVKVYPIKKVDREYFNGDAACK